MMNSYKVSREQKDPLVPLPRSSPIDTSDMVMVSEESQKAGTGVRVQSLLIHLV